MDKFNLNLYVEQVTCEAEDSKIDGWVENDQLALNNVIDANTEFKTARSDNITPTPSYSYNLKNSHDLEPTKLLEQKLERNLSRELFQLHSGCLDKELEETLEGTKNWRKRSISDSSLVPKVHAFTSTHLITQEENPYKEMNIPQLTIHDAELQPHLETHNKLLKYPQDRITVVTEKCSYLIRSKNDIKSSELNQQNITTANAIENSIVADTHMISPSSHESITAGNMVIGQIPRKRSLVSIHSLGNMDRSLTTADQLAWEFRRAREKLETASNISGCSSRFEIESNYSEKAETMSTISDVSGYEEEMFRIKRLLLLDSTTPTPPPGKHEKIRNENILSAVTKNEGITFSKESIEVEIHRLTIQLQNALAEKEKYKMEAVMAETKATLECQEKYREVLLQKSHLEGRLEMVQAEMSSLVSEKKEIIDRTKSLEQELKLRTAADSKLAFEEMQKLVMETNRLQQVIRELDTRNQDLVMQLEFKGSEVNQCKKEIQTTDDSNEKLRIELQELKIETESKEGAIQGLKNKISEQHIEFQSILQTKLKAENNITSLKNEIESVKKSELWYRDNLHTCQAAKVKVQQELMACQAMSISQSHQIEKFKGEIMTLQHLVEDTQQKAVREKDTLLRKLEIIQADMLERENTILSQINTDSTAETVSTIAAKLKKMEEEKSRMVTISDASVQEFKEQIISLKNQLQIKETTLGTCNSENAQLITRITMLQKTLNDKELALQLLENKYKNVEMAHNHLAENFKVKEQMFMDLKNEKVTIEVALSAAGKEKTEVDSAICKLREDFNRITNNYQAMKSDLREKEKHITNFKRNETENQNLIKKLNEFKKVQEENKQLQDRISMTETLEKQVEEMSTTNNKLNLKIEEINLAYNYMKQQMLTLKETITAREEQLVNQTRNFEVHCDAVIEHSLQELQNEKEAGEEIIKELHTRILQLESSNKIVAEEVVSLKKQLVHANGALDQFNLLCRKSEEEKSHIEKKLKKITEELETAKKCYSSEQNGSILSSVKENVKFQTSEVRSVTKHENGMTQNSVHQLFELIQNIEVTLVTVLTDCLKNQQLKMQKEETNNKSVVSFDTVVSMLLNINESLKGILLWKDQTITEIQVEKEKNELLKNELTNLRNETKVKPLEEVKKENSIYFSLTEQKNVQTCGTQTFSEKIEHKNVQTCETLTLNENINHKSIQTCETQIVNDNIKHKEQIEQYQKEITKLRGSLKISEIENREKHKKYESNTRILLKKVKEHMRGRKTAESALQEFRKKVDEANDTITLNNEIVKLKVQLEATEKKYFEQKSISEKNEEAMLLLEKERGKLEESCTISKERLPLTQSVPEYNDNIIYCEFEQKTLQLQLIQTKSRITELEEQLRKSHIIIKDLKKEIFNEKCESSQLRKQLSSLRMGLDTANDMLDTKKVELGRTESLCCVLETNISHLKKQLETEQQTHEECKQELEKLREVLEETKAKDPILADQIKTLSYHLHQKTQEAAGLHEKIQLSDERWSANESSLQRNMSALQEELSSLRSELDSVLSDKFTLQTQAAELRAALLSNIEQSKILRLKLETFGCEHKDKLPDLTSSLPLPPTKYDEAYIAELLQQSKLLPHNKPLNNLQCCLDLLKQEMTTLQRQLAVKTSEREQTDRGIQNISTQSSIKDV